MGFPTYSPIQTATIWRPKPRNFTTSRPRSDSIRVRFPLASTAPSTRVRRPPEVRGQVPDLPPWRALCVPPVVTFCYIDGSISKPSGFDTYLIQYGDLIAQLRSSRVLYVASDQQMFAKARRIFSRLLGASSFGIRFGLGKVELQRLLEHFGTRQLFEQRNTGSLSKRNLDQFRDEFEEFRGRDYEALYRQWQLQGEVQSKRLSCLAKNRSHCLTPIAWTTTTRFLARSRRGSSLQLRQYDRILLVDGLIRGKIRPHQVCGAAIRCVLRTSSVRSHSLRITACGLDPRAGATPVCGRLSRHKPASLVPSLRGSLPPLVK